MEDGRVVSNFILQSLQNKDVTVYGDGLQTRSFQYVDDLVDGLIGLMNSGKISLLKLNLILDITSPVNIGNPDEHTISEFADLIIKLTSSQSRIVNMPAAQVIRKKKQYLKTKFLKTFSGRSTTTQTGHFKGIKRIRVETENGPT